MTKRCAEYDTLQAVARRCEQEHERFPDDSIEHKRAREILTAMAGHCRTAASVFGIDPTLATEPRDTGRFRSIDLLAELGRMIRPLLRQACSDHKLDRDHHPERWEEVEAIVVRAGQIARSTVDVVPRRDYFTVVGRRRISRERLAARAHHLSEAAGEIRHACDVQLGPQAADPLVAYLAGMVSQLERYAEVLTTEREKTNEVLSASLCLPTHP